MPRWLPVRSDASGKLKKNASALCDDPMQSLPWNDLLLYVFALSYYVSTYFVCTVPHE